METRHLYDIVGIDNPMLDILYTKEGRKKLSGGATTNSVILLQHFGFKTAMMGRIGDDEFGERIIRELKSYDVDVSRLRKEGRTQKIFIQVTPEEREIIREEDSYPLDKLSKNDISCIASSRSVLMRTVSPLFPEVSYIANEHSVMMFANLQGMKPTDYTIELLQHANIDTIFGNKMEVKKIENLLENILKRGIKVLETQGKKGCKLYTNSEIKEYQGYRVESVDPTGAGDAFTAGFIYGRLNQWGLDRSCDFANRAGALATTYYGARGRRLTLEEIWSLK